MQLCCVNSEPCAHSSGSICSCGISPPFSALQFKIVSLLYSRHVDHCHGYIHPVSDRVQAGRIWSWVQVCAAIDACFWRFPCRWQNTLWHFLLHFLYSLRSDVYSISCDFFETEVPERTRRTLNERLNSALEKGEKCAEAFHCYCDHRYRTA